MKRPLYAAVCTFILCVLSAVVTPPALAKGGGTARAQLVEIEPVASQSWGDVLEGVGTVYARNQIEVISQTEGVISEVKATDGLAVKRGQLLVQLDPGYPQALLAEARAQLQDDERRLSELSQLTVRNAISESSLAEQQAKVLMARARVDAAEVTLSYYSLIAPFDGVLGLGQLSEGQYIQRGEALLSLTDLDSLYVDFGLPSQYLSQLRVGQSLRLHFSAWPDQSFSAAISSIAPVVDTQSRNVRIRTELDNPDQKLRPGLLVQILVELDQHNSTVVPTSAIFFRGTQAYVYRVDETGVARSVAIETGASRGDQTQVLRGLQPGLPIVVAGVGKLSDGSRVTDVRSDREEQAQ